MVKKRLNKMNLNLLAEKSANNSFHSLKMKIGKRMLMELTAPKNSNFQLNKYSSKSRMRFVQF